MANARWRKINQFLATNEFAKVQTAFGISMANALLNFRENCEVEWEENIERGQRFNCSQEDLISEPVKSRYMRFRFIFAQYNPQRAANYIALKEGVASAMTGTPMDEIQLLTKTGNITSGTFKILLEDFEGRTGTTNPIAWNATPAQIKAAMLSKASYLNLGRMLQKEDVSLAGGTAQVETMTIAGAIDADGNIPVTVTALNKPALVAGKTIQVAVINGDSAAVVAGKVRAALIADADIGHPTTGFFAITGAGANVIATAKTRAANDATINLAFSNGTATGLVPNATSTDTTAGIAQTEFGAGVFVNFGGRFAKADLPLLSIDNSSLVGGTIAVSSVQNGEQRMCDISRSLDGEKPQFTFALGDKNGSIATDKYQDAVVESIDFTLNENDTDAAMTVTIACGYVGEEQESFSVPPCVNTLALLAQDCRILINDIYEQRDLVNHAVALNDNVPTGAAFRFDDIDLSSPFQRGNQPSQLKTTEHYGAKGCPTYILAEAEAEEGNEVPFVTELGLPKNRLRIIAEETKIKFQQNRTGFAGDLLESSVKITGTPYALTDIPVRYEYYGDQTEQFLLTA